MAELKKDYLKKHLYDVEKVIENWSTELNAPPPYTNKSLWGWAYGYFPTEEQNPEHNHMIRKHLKSRTLWKHHSVWETKIRNIASLIDNIAKYAASIKTDLLSTPNRAYTKDFLECALWQGYELASGANRKLEYKPSKDGNGVTFGAFTIEAGATSPDIQQLIIKEHQYLIRNISGLGWMTELVSEWREVESLQQRMQNIINEAIKSHNILFPCRYCRRLWK